MYVTCKKMVWVENVGIRYIGKTWRRAGKSMNRVVSVLRRQSNDGRNVKCLYFI